MGSTHATRDIAASIALLHRAAESGALVARCRERGVALLVLFGSAVTLADAVPEPGPAATTHPGATDPAPQSPQAQPHDIDLAVLPEYGASVDQLALLTDLYELTREERFDLLMLDRAGPVARQRALTTGRKLVETSPSLFAETQIAAMMEYYDTAPLRRLELDLLAQA